MILAETLVRELMLVSVLVAGEGADALAAALTDAGAAADVLTGSHAAEGFDLAILLAAPGAAGASQTRDLVDALSRSSDRLLLAPLPLGDVASQSAPALPELEQWFELFAELGYQPVVEFDAGFVSAGAFLVDRAATAAEGDLAAFTDRLQLGADAVSQQRETVQEAERSVRTDLQAARAALAAREEELLGLHATLDTCQSDLHAAGQSLAATEGSNAGWDALRVWVRAEAGSPTRNTADALRRDLPRLNALRAPDLPPVAAPSRPARSWLARLSRRPAGEITHPVLESAAAVRASTEFDAAWYVASHPADFEGAPLDPVFHYVLVGGPRGADPGPFFDTQAYLLAHPDAGAVPLVHALGKKAVLF